MNKTKEFSFLPSRGLLLLIFFFLFILILTLVFGDRGILEIVKRKNEISRLGQTIHTLEAEKNALQRDVNQLRNDPQAIEKKAREKLWLVKKNEKLIIIEKKHEKNKEEKHE